MDESKYIVTYDHPLAPGLYSVRRHASNDDAVGSHVAAHKNIEAVRVAIPTSHYKAPYARVAPIIEVWVHNSVPK